MPDPAVLLTFVAASTALVLVPGPNLVFIVTQSMSRGTRAGLAAAAGVELGTLVYVLATVMGVSALIASSDLAYTAVKYAGIAYLVHLAVHVLRRPPALELAAGGAARSPWRACRDGAIVNLLNPKVGLFFLAFLPQFVDTGPGAASTGTQLTVLGLVILALALSLDIGYAVAGGAAGRVIRTRGRALRFLRWPVAAIYVGLAAYAVWS